MGATTYTAIAKGENVKEVFDRLVEEAEYQYGRDSYNGTISTTQLGNKIEVGKMAHKTKYEDLWNLFDENDDTLFSEKWMTNYANLGVDHYKAFTANWISDEDIPKREKGVQTLNEYSVVWKEDSHMKTKTYQSIKKFKTLTDSKRAAKEMAVKEGKSVTIKKHRSNGDMFNFGHFNLVSDGKEYKSARTAKTKIYKPIYRFAFFVYASC